MQLEKLKNILRMDSLDDEVLLESCCLAVIIRKEKRTWVCEIFLTRIDKEFIIIYCRRLVPVIEDPILGNLYNELFSKTNKEKCTASQSMAWFLTVHKKTIRNY